MALVLIDADGTLIEGAHSEPLFVRRLLLRGWLGARQLAAFAYFPCRHGARYGRHVFRKNKAYLSGLGLADIVREAAELVDAELLGRVSRPLGQRIRGHGARGDTLVLLTGTLDPIARPLAERCEIPHVVATACDTRGDRFTARPPRRHPFGEAKVVEAEALRRRFGVPWSDCVAYADSVYDLPLMVKVGRPVAVAPDRGLRAQANRRGWELLAAQTPGGAG